jgi:hypothetical protein
MKKQPRTARATLVLALLWAVAFYGAFFVFIHGLATKRWPWTGSKEQLRVDGERVVAALEEYKAAHGHYPKTLHEVGIDASQPYSYCYYHPHDTRASTETDTAVTALGGFSLTVSSGPDEWEFHSDSKEWTWYFNVGSGG